jgi:hypothetical protein
MVRPTMIFASIKDHTGRFGFCPTAGDGEDLRQVSDAGSRRGPQTHELRCLPAHRHYGVTTSINAAKRRKSASLNVSSRRSPCASIVATTLASWT